MYPLDGSQHISEESEVTCARGGCRRRDVLPPARSAKLKMIYEKNMHNAEVITIGSFLIAF